MPIRDSCVRQSEKPKFKSRRKSKPSFYNDNIKLKVKNNIVLIEKVGWVNMIRTTTDRC